MKATILLAISSPSTQLEPDDGEFDLAPRQDFIHPGVSKHLPNGSLIIVFAVALVFVKTVCALVIPQTRSSPTTYASRRRPTSGVQLHLFLILSFNDEL